MRDIDANASGAQAGGMHQRRRVVIVTFEDVQVLDVTGPHEVFAGASRLVEPARPGYDGRVVSLDGGPVRSESGLALVTESIGRLPPGPIDTVLVPGGFGIRVASADDATVAAVRQLAARSRRVVSVCSGAFVLAAAGLLDGKRVTTHWARGAQLARRFPTVEVDTNPIWTRDGDVWTSAGVTAGIDLALALVEDDHGPDVAVTAARWLVMFLRRPGGQSQFASPVWRTPARTEPIRRAQDLIDGDPGGDHRVRVLASRVAMSERHFLRRFADEVGTTPAQYVAAARLDAARRELEQSDDTVAAIARRCGFGTAESMRRTFLRHLGAPPDDYRRRFRLRRVS